MVVSGSLSIRRQTATVQFTVEEVKTVRSVNRERKNNGEETVIRSVSGLESPKTLFWVGDEWSQSSLRSRTLCCTTEDIQPFYSCQ